MPSRTLQNKAKLLAEAANYLAFGWYLFLVNKLKKPFAKGGFKNATNSAVKLDQTLTRFPESMLAVRTGAESGIVVVDVDVDASKGVDGRPWLEAARKKGFPACPMATTPRGGLHLYFKHPGVPVPNSASRLYPGVDVRGDGGYAVTPPSRSELGVYAWEVSPQEVPPPDMPDWLLDDVTRDEEEERDSDATALSDADREAAKKQIANCLKRVREAKPGARNHTLNTQAWIVGKMVGAGVAHYDDVRNALIEAGKAAGLPHSEAKGTAESGLRAGQRHPWRPRSVNALLNEMNRDHFYALQGKTGFVHRETRNPLTGHAELELISPGAFRELWANKEIVVGTGDRAKVVPAGAMWPKWPGRRQYDRVVFAPGRSLPANIYNTWLGFPYEPMEGDCAKFLDFVLKIICAGDGEVFDYLMSWLARAVQKPAEPGEVAIVMRGEKGAGKTFFADHVGELFGEHYAQLSHSHHLVGHFNAHLENAIVVFADEAFWAGDKQGEGVLKTLITGRALRIERKGVDAKSVPNHVHLLMASNADWVVPASGDERRFAVLDVSNARRQDHPYFKELQEEWESGGREAFFHVLMTRDISHFNVRQAPATRGLVSQKLLSMPPIDQWYLEMLKNGSNSDSHDWADWVSAETLRSRFNDWATQQGVRHVSPEAFGMSLLRLLPPRKGGAEVRCQRSFHGKRQWGYEFASLDDCRRHFEQRLGAAMAWETEGELDEKPIGTELRDEI